MNTKFLRLKTTVIGASAIGLAFGGAIAYYQSPIVAETFKESKKPVPIKQTQPSESNQLLAENSEEKTRIQVYEKASPAVVAIAFGLGHGSGFIVSPDGLVLTNAHVVQDAPSTVAVVLADGKQVLADVVGFADEGIDLAALKIRNQKNLPFLRLAAPGSVRVGQSVYAIGTPLKVESYRNTFTEGVVSRIDTKSRLIQHDAAVNPGNSGGPLLNSNGEVIGVNSEIFTDTGTFIGISLAIPTDVVKPFLVAVEQGNSSKATQRQQPSDTQVRDLLANGQVVQATLKKGDPVLPNNSYSHFYAFEGKAGQQLTVEMASSQIDPNLYLLLPAKDEAKQKLVAQNDDVSSKNFNAKLTVTLPEDGVYYLLANTFEPGESGNYSLRAVAK